ncbi:hypothetical protein AB0N89_20075 [Amycolatopsis sp. NPDC089917]
MTGNGSCGRRGRGRRPGSRGRALVLLALAVAVAAWWLLRALVWPGLPW